MQFILGVYAFLLNLYPLDFLDKFRDELQTVFELSLRDASQNGKWKLLPFLSVS